VYPVKLTVAWESKVAAEDQKLYINKEIRHIQTDTETATG
jgi:hypothetical protein